MKIRSTNIPLDKFIAHGTWGIDLDDFVDSYVAENAQYADGMYSLPYSKTILSPNISIKSALCFSSIFTPINPIKLSILQLIFIFSAISFDRIKFVFPVKCMLFKFLRLMIF